MSFFTEEWLVEIWLNAENTNFGGSKPIKLIENGRSDKVIAFIKAALDENKR